MLRRRFMELISGAPALGLPLNTKAMEQEPSHPATTAVYEANWSPLVVADATDYMVVSAMGDLISTFMPDHWTSYGYGKRFIVDPPQQLPHPLSRLAIRAEQIHELPDIAKDNQALITFEREGSKTARLLDSVLKDAAIPILRVVAASKNHVRPLAASSELRLRHSKGIHWLEFQNPWEVALFEQFSKAMERAGGGLGECTLAEMEAEGLPLGELFSRAVNFSAKVLALSYARMATTNNPLSDGPLARVEVMRDGEDRINSERIQSITSRNWSRAAIDPLTTSLPSTTRMSWRLPSLD